MHLVLPGLPGRLALWDQQGPLALRDQPELLRLLASRGYKRHSIARQRLRQRQLSSPGMVQHGRVILPTQRVFATFTHRTTKTLLRPPVIALTTCGLLIRRLCNADIGAALDGGELAAGRDAA